MSLSKKLLKRANLYLILDAEVLSYKDLLKTLKPAVRAGVDIVQLRNKKGHAKDILEFSKEARRILSKKALFIMNDRVDLAILSKADGVHLGQQDVSYAQARTLMGSQSIIGVSCQDLEHAKKAQRQGASYIGFGSVFKTQTKPERQPMKLELLKTVVQTIKIPIFAIGGINLSNLGKVKEVGVSRIAVCRDILLAKDVDKRVREFKRSL